MTTFLLLAFIAVLIMAAIGIREANRTHRPSLDGSWWGSEIEGEDR